MSDTTERRAVDNDGIIAVLRTHMRAHRDLVARLERGEVLPTLALQAALVDYEAGARHMLITANSAEKRMREQRYRRPAVRR